MAENTGIQWTHYFGGHPKGKEPTIDGKYYREFPDLTPNKRNDV